MFSGIVQGTGSVVELVKDGESGRLCVRSSLFADVAGVDAAAARRPLQLGESIAISGVCLTAVSWKSDSREGDVLFDLSSETIRRTVLGELRNGSTVNVERSLRFGDPVDGHLMQGHVDSVGSVLARTQEGNTTRFEISIPAELSALIAVKGSVAVDGVSLTVGERTDTSFSVYLIPHSLAVTTFGSLQAGSKVNLEADLFARYSYEILARGAGFNR